MPNAECKMHKKTKGTQTNVPFEIERLMIYLIKVKCPKYQAMVAITMDGIEWKDDYLCGYHMRSLMKSFLLLNVFCSDNDKAFDIFYSTILCNIYVFGIQCQIVFFAQQQKWNN